MYKGKICIRNIDGNNKKQTHMPGEGERGG